MITQFEEKCMRINHLGAKAAASMIAACFLTSGLAAQEFPDHRITLVVPYATGGSIDLSARRVAEFLSEELGQPVIVENRAGANAITATEAVSRAKADGYTLLYTTLAAHAGNLLTHADLPYDSFEDFEAVTVLNTPPTVVVVHPSFPADTFEELLAIARERPRDVTVAHYGLGGAAHLKGVQLSVMGGIEITPVGYPGGGPALTDVVGGHVDVYFPPVATAMEFIKADRLKVLAAFSAEPLPLLPEVPLITATPGFEELTVLDPLPYVLAPAGTPEDVINTIQEAAVRAVANPAFRESAMAAGEGEPFATTPSEAEQRLGEYLDQLKALYEAAGIEAQ